MLIPYQAQSMESIVRDLPQLPFSSDKTELLRHATRWHNAQWPILGMDPWCLSPQKNSTDYF